MHGAAERPERREERFDISVEKILATMLSYVKKNTFCHRLTSGAFFAPMTGRSDNNTGSERCTETLKAVCGHLQK